MGPEGLVQQGIWVSVRFQLGLPDCCVRASTGDAHVLLRSCQPVAACIERATQGRGNRSSASHSS